MIVLWWVSVPWVAFRLAQSKPPKNSLYTWIVVLCLLLISPLVVLTDWLSEGPIIDWSE